MAPRPSSGKTSNIYIKYNNYNSEKGAKPEEIMTKRSQTRRNNDKK
jgi:hypothetical protein